MIAPLLRAPRASQPVLGAKIETLYECYKELPALASFFEYEGGGFLALFGGRLTVCGSIPSDELMAFADFVGAYEIEGLENELPEVLGFEKTEHPIMSCGESLSEEEPKKAQDLMQGYDVLAEADSKFADACDKWEWLSDMTRRRNCQKADVYAQNGAAVIITAKNSRELVIGAVASIPKERNKGAASKLVTAVCAKAQKDGLCPVTVAADESVSRFYERLGFETVGRLVLLTRKVSL